MKIRYRSSASLLFLFFVCVLVRRVSTHVNVRVFMLLGVYSCQCACIHVNVPVFVSICLSSCQCACIRSLVSVPVSMPASVSVSVSMSVSISAENARPRSFHDPNLVVDTDMEESGYEYGYEGVG